ncbi:hypothetical protein EGR_10346 [Echinococcus granulosus]|uniref:Uncharacterized protein n=1 Tax=Echinococcus granulosus TaxID=6210 RepID=W6U189_ECHGR|nr:hypothetical protein EGR_10346 [Echinococcus granulosus]EUB54793.1 hypothetical protein EGR_10346 [Echinococcus granulosus]
MLLMESVSSYPSFILSSHQAGGVTFKRIHSIMMYRDWFSMMPKVVQSPKGDILLISSWHCISEYFRRKCMHHPRISEFVGSRCCLLSSRSGSTCALVSTPNFEIQAHHFCDFALMCYFCIVVTSTSCLHAEIGRIFYFKMFIHNLFTKFDVFPWTLVNLLAFTICKTSTIRYFKKSLNYSQENFYCYHILVNSAYFNTYSHIFIQSFGVKCVLLKILLFSRGHIIFKAQAIFYMPTQIHEKILHLH